MIIAHLPLSWENGLLLFLKIKQKNNRKAMYIVTLYIPTHLSKQRTEYSFLLGVKIYYFVKKYSLYSFIVLGRLIFQKILNELMF